MSVGRMLRKGTTGLFLVGLVLSVMLWAASYFFSIAMLSGTSTMWEMAKGCVAVDRNIHPTVVHYGGPQAAGGIGGNSIYRVGSIHRFWKSRGFDGWETIWTPKLKLKPLRIVIPLWIPTLLFLTLTWKRISPVCRRARNKRRGLCTSCSYDLTGKMSGVCPECGTKVEYT